MNRFLTYLAEAPALTLDWLKHTLVRSSPKLARYHDETAHFILPDGSVWAALQEGIAHATAVKPFGLYRVLEDLQVVRVGGPDAYECAAPITDAQAQTICAIFDLTEASNNIVDCMDGGESFATTRFEKFTKPSVIRNWVNARFSMSEAVDLHEAVDLKPITALRMHLDTTSTPRPTGFYLPDGTRLQLRGGAYTTHIAACRAAGTTLAAVLAAGAIRSVPDGIMIAAPITDAQARVLDADYHNLNLRIDVMHPDNDYPQRADVLFTKLMDYNRHPADGIRRWIRRAVSGTLTEAVNLTDKTWYHGGAAVAPIFMTTSLKGAEWYAKERGGTIRSYTVGVTQPFVLDGEASAKRLADLLTAHGVRVAFVPSGRYGWSWHCPAVTEHSPYDGDNPIDIVYVPDAVKALHAAGYDSFFMPHDVLDDLGDIPALVVFDQRFVHPLGHDDLDEAVEQASWFHGRYQRMGGAEQVDVYRGVPDDAASTLRPYDHVFVGHASAAGSYGDKIIHARVPMRELIGGDEAGPLPPWARPGWRYRPGFEARWVPPGYDPSDARFTYYWQGPAGSAPNPKTYRRPYRDVYGESIDLLEVYRQGFIAPSGDDLPGHGDDHTDQARAILGSDDTGSIRRLIDQGYVRYWYRTGEIDLNFRANDPQAAHAALKFLNDNWMDGDRIYMDIEGARQDSPFYDGNKMGLRHARETIRRVGNLGRLDEEAVVLLEAATPAVLSTAAFVARFPASAHLWRGVDSAAGAAATRRGELGDGDFGPGIYFSRLIGHAQGYAQHGTRQGVILRAALRPGAVVKAPPANLYGADALDRWARQRHVDVIDLDNYQVVRNPAVLVFDARNYTVRESVVLDYRAHGYTLPPGYEDEDANLQEAVEWDDEDDDAEVLVESLPSRAVAFSALDAAVDGLFTEASADLVTRMRTLPTLTRATSWGRTDFVLPDGTCLMLSASAQQLYTHAMIVAPLFGVEPTDVDGRNAALAQVLKAGVVRVVHDGIDVGGSMTEAQANAICDGFARAMNLSVKVDVQDTARRQVIHSREFENPVKPAVLRAWVNHHV